MIVWLNGAFGVGKTSTARELLELIPGSVLFDPELVGSALRDMLPHKRIRQVDDYQDLPAWRRLVVDTAAALLNEVPGPLVVPMTLLRQEYRDEIFGGLAARRVQVRHFLLHADETILRKRIEQRVVFPEDPQADADVRGWCVDHIDDYQAARTWLEADACVVEAGAANAAESAERVAELLAEGAAVREIVQTPEPTAATLAAGVLLFDARGRVLLVDPTYKPGWEFPGGVVEPGEAPACGGVREVGEELGLELTEAPSLLVVDWEPPKPPGFGGLRLLFDGGVLAADQHVRLRLPGDELRDWRFVTEEEAADLLPPVRRARLHWALRAREQSTVLYLEAGTPVGR
ncbi:NUDIX hydrolase [Wenjunlia tyrosinilytica]|uniref:ATP/GTP-binding protein n=1 Tax=Wenjunlia tyrosinilytica TaxID=1544741 RepID=A0A918DZS3_9ACTN|nr:NUDIX hydrolase [Wenjunlia tyrosinilytica]GGO96305.1 ATP/GTP-binding protein [Wenjunlia tyrosinilytica]